MGEASEEEEAVTRCPCGNNEDQEGFMLQCETCSVWQHGRCVGLTEQTAPDGDYFCDLCMPDHPIHTAFAARKKKEAEKKVSVKAKKSGKKDKRRRTRDDDDDESSAPPKKARTAAAALPQDSGPDLLSTPDEQLSREDRKLKKLMESFQRMEDRQKRKDAPPKTPTAVKTASAASEGSSTGARKDAGAPSSSAHQEAKKTEAKRGETKKGEVKKGAKKEDTKKSSVRKEVEAKKAKEDEPETPRSRLRGGVRRDRSEKPPRRAPRKRQTPRPSARKDRKEQRVRTRSGPPSEPSRLDRRTLHPLAPMYLGKKNFLLKTFAAAEKVAQKSQRGPGGFHAHFHDAAVPMRKRIALAYRTDPTLLHQRDTSSNPTTSKPNTAHGASNGIRHPP